METDIGNPIEYNPTVSEEKDDENKEERVLFSSIRNGELPTAAHVSAAATTNTGNI
jgi:hypothetical protein